MVKGSHCFRWRLLTSQRDKKIQFKVGSREVPLGGHTGGVGVGLYPAKTASLLNHSNSILQDKVDCLQKISKADGQRRVAGYWFTAACPKAVRSGDVSHGIERLRMETAREANTSFRSQREGVAGLWPESQAKAAVGFWAGRIVVPVLSEAFCTAHSGDSEFVMVLAICPKTFLWNLDRSWVLGQMGALACFRLLCRVRISWQQMMYSQ